MSFSTSDKLTLVGIAIAALAALYPFVQHLRAEQNKLKNLYRLVWERASHKKVREQLLRDRPVPSFYLRKKEVQAIREWLAGGENVAIAGQPLSGKTRLVFEAIGEQPWDVLMPDWVNINPESFVLPRQGQFGRRSQRRGIVVLDDLQRLVEMQSFNVLLEKLRETGLTVVATCRSMEEEQRVRRYFNDQNLDFDRFFPQRLSLSKIELALAQEIALKENINWEEKVKFDGTIGSIFLPLKEMESRFEHCDRAYRELATILRGLAQLYRCGIYQENQFFPRRWIKLLAQVKGLMGTEAEWSDWLSELYSREFVTLRPGGEGVEVEAVYLEKVVTVKPGTARSLLAEMAEGLTVFAEEAEALYRLGSRAYEVGLNDLDKARYQRLAIKAFEGALLFYPPEQFPINYAEIQNNLGNAYQALGEMEDKESNCQAAIAAYQEALKIYTRDRFQMDYAAVQNNMGNTHRTLAEVKNKANHCKQAIFHYQNALNFYNRTNLPKEYAMTQNNMGIAYATLAEIENTVSNCQQAIAAYQEALTIYTRDRFPMQYANTQNNLGTAYGTLASVEDKAENCKAAIAAYQEALTIRTRDRFPMQYAGTQNNLGIAYGTLASVEDKAENCKAAIAASQESLTLYTRDRFPMQYATTQNNLGIAYGTLGQVEDKAENCKAAIAAYQEALTISTRDRFPMDYAMTQNNMGNAYLTLGRVEDKAENCKAAIAAYLEALTISTRDRFPMDYAGTQNNMGNAYLTLGEVEDKAVNCKAAKQAYEEALQIFTAEQMAVPCQIVTDNITRLDSLMSED